MCVVDEDGVNSGGTKRAQARHHPSPENVASLPALSPSVASRSLPHCKIPRATPPPASLLRGPADALPAGPPLVFSRFFERAQFILATSDAISPLSVKAGHANVLLGPPGFFFPRPRPSAAPAFSSLPRRAHRSSRASEGLKAEEMSKSRTRSDLTIRCLFIPPPHNKRPLCPLFDLAESINHDPCFGDPHFSL